MCTTEAHMIPTLSTAVSQTGNAESHVIMVYSQHSPWRTVGLWLDGQVDIEELPAALHQLASLVQVTHQTHGLPSHTQDSISKQNSVRFGRTGMRLMAPMNILRSRLCTS